MEAASEGLVTCYLSLGRRSRTYSTQLRFSFFLFGFFGFFPAFIFRHNGASFVFYLRASPETLIAYFISRA